MPNFNLPDIIDRSKKEDKFSSTEHLDPTQFSEEQAPERVQAPVETSDTPTSSKEKPGLLDYGVDASMIGLRGAEGFAEGVWGLLDWVTGDRLWDWDRKEHNLFGVSKTVPGMLGEGAVQFAAGFIPGLNVAGWLGKATKAGKIVGKSGDLLSKGVIQHAYRGNRTLKLSTLRKIKKAKPKVQKAAQLTAAGAMADFVAFKGEEARLSNLLISNKGEDSNAILEYLAYDPEQDNNEIEERFKNVVEGLFVGGALGSLFLGARAGVKGLSKTGKEAASGLTKTFKIFRDKGKNLEEQRLRGEEPDEVEAYAKAVEDNVITPEEQKALRTVESQAKDAQIASEYEAVTRRKISEETKPEIVTMAKKAVKDAEEIEKVALKETTEEAPAVIRRKDGKPFKTQAGAKAALSKAGLNVEDYKVSESKDGGFEGVKVETKEEATEKVTSPEELEAPKYAEIDIENASEEQIDDWILDNLGTTMRASDLASKREYVKDIIGASSDEELVLRKIEAHVEKRISEAGLFSKTNPQAASSAIHLAKSMPELRASALVVAKAARAAAAKKTPATEAQAKVAAKTFDETAEFVANAVEMAGGNKQKTLHFFQAFKNRPKDIEAARYETEALWGFMNEAGQDITKKAFNAEEARTNEIVDVVINGENKTLNYEEAMTELYSSIDRFMALQEVFADYGTQFSLGLRIRNDLFTTGSSSLGRDIAGQNRVLGFEGRGDTQAARLYRRGVNSSMTEKKFLKKLLAQVKTGKAANPKDMGKALNDAEVVALNSGLSKFLSSGRKLMAVTQEWYINALLGSPTTWTVNIIGNGLTMALRHFELTSGALLTGNTKLLKANLRALFDVHSFIDSVRYAFKAGMDDEAKSVKGFTAYNDNRTGVEGAIHIDNPDSNVFYSGINWLGKLVRHPSRVLMAGDEFFKQMNFRAHTKTMLALEGYQKGYHKNPKALAEFVNSGFEGLITKEGRFRNEDNVRNEAYRALAKKRKGKNAVTNERQFIADYMNTHFNNHEIKLENGEIYSAKDFGQRAELVENATDWSLVNTFTNNPTNPVIKALSNLAMFSPWLTFVIPFVRTPSNIITFALGRTVPIGSVGKFGSNFLKKNRKAYSPIEVDKASKQYGDMPNASLMIEEKMELLNRVGSFEAAEYTGRLAFSAMTISSTFLLVEGIRDKITGAAPESRTKRAAWEADGKQPYSIKLDLGEGERWYSYQRLDPFATILGIFADITHGFADTRETGEGEFGTEDELEEKQDEIKRVVGVLGMSFANNITNKSYVENLAQFFDLLRKPNYTGTQVLGNTIAGFVPNALNVSQNVFQEDPEILESRALLDKLMKKLPEGMRPKIKGSSLISEKLMPRRNFLGEAKRKQHTGGLIKGLNPIFMSDVSDDVVDMEIASQGTGKGNISPIMSVAGERINMHDYRNSEGQTAYDRVQELSGTIKRGPQKRTLRQSLRTLIESDDYQNLPDVTEKNSGPAHPRTKLIARIINFYRAEAKREVFNEFPELKNDYASLLQ